VHFFGKLFTPIFCSGAENAFRAILDEFSEQHQYQDIFKAQLALFW
jgi:hypothetical protein